MRLLQQSVRPRRFSALAIAVSASMAGSLIVAGALGAAPAHAVPASGPALALFAGDGQPGVSTDQVGRRATHTDTPASVTTDGLGNTFILATGDNRIIKVDSAGQATIFAGDGSQGGYQLNQQATASPMDNPQMIAADSTGNVYVADPLAGILQISPSGYLTAYALGFAATVVTVAPDGDVYTTYGNLVRAYSAPNSSTDVADLNNAQPYAYQRINGLAVDSDGVIYISDGYYGYLTSYDPGTSQWTTLATFGAFVNSGQIAIDSAGTIYIAGGDSHVVSTMTTAQRSSGASTVIAGTGTSGAGAAPVAGPGTGTALTSPRGVALSSSGTVYVADAGSNYVVSLATTVPAAPANVTSQRGDGQIEVDFDAPDDGGSAITGYEYSFNGTTGWTTLDIDSSGAQIAGTVTGLVNGTPYTISIRAVNAVGAGPVVAAPAATPSTTPGIPSNVSVTALSGAARLDFTAPGAGGRAVRAYAVKVDGGVATTLTTTPATPAPGVSVTGTVTGLTNAVQHSIVLYATNANGNGQATAPVTVTPALLPVAPILLSATRGNTTAALTYTPSADQPTAPVTGYQATTNAGSSWTTLTGPDVLTGSGVLTGLTNGTTYTVAIRAVNRIGGSPPSASGLAVTPATTPGAPSTPLASVADGSTTLTFDPPASDGGASISGYEISADSGGWVPLTTTGTVHRSATVSPLVNGTSYSLRVRAVNSAGGGTASAAVVVIPATVPSAPSGVIGAGGHQQVTLTFITGASNGRAIDSYQYSSDAGSTWHTFATTAAMPFGLTRTGTTAADLTNGTSYTFLVRAVNSQGNGAASAASAPVIPADVPAAPGTITLTAGNASATASFTKPADGASAITGYEFSVGGGSVWVPLTSVTLTSSTVSGVVAPLANGQANAVRIRALNGFGPGAASAAVTVTPISVVAPPVVPTPVPPGAPSGPSGAAAIGSITVSWSAGTPSDGTTGYTVTASPGGATCSTTGATRCVVPGTAGTAYTFTVTAHSLAGDSPASEASAPVTPRALIIPVTVPLDAPTTLTTPDGALAQVQADQDLTVIGGGYAPGTSAQVTIYSTPISLGTTTTDSTGTISLNVTIPAGLEKGQHNIVATGVAPDGTQRSIRMPVTLVSTPVVTPPPASAPKILGVGAGNRQITLTFAAAKARAKVKITGYEFTVSSGRHWRTLKTTGSARRSVTIRGLANGHRYGVQVRAVTSAGAGTASTLVRVTPSALTSKG